MDTPSSTRSSSGSSRVRAGVLIIGSLAWDPRDGRERWRAERLQMGERRRVTAPIRYGRRSSNWHDTYTMVVSPGCVSGGVGTGTALAVPFRRPFRRPEDLLHEASEIWRAESRRPDHPSGVVSGGWGSVGLLTNPGSAAARELTAPWSDAVRQSPDYGRLPAAPDEGWVVCSETGQVNVPWPRSRSSGEPLDLDLLLLTATAAHIDDDGQYPEPRLLAEAWNRAPEAARYFRRNRDMGIETPHDPAIQARLRV